MGTCCGMLSENGSVSLNWVATNERNQYGHMKAKGQTNQGSVVQRMI